MSAGAIPRETAAGALAVALGLGGLAAAWPLPAGDATEMGPGFVPDLVFGAMVLLGLLVAARDLRKGAERLRRAPLRPVATLTAAGLAFALLLPLGGAVLAVPATVVVAGFAAAPLPPLRLALLAAGLTAFVVAVFIQALGVPMPVIWR